MFRTDITTLWDKYLIIFGVPVLIGIIAYKFQLAILMFLFLGFVTWLLASAFGR